MSTNDYTDTPPLGELHLTLVPQADCRFRGSLARALHGALLRRLELLAPDLSLALHEAPAGGPASDHPWTLSTLLGNLRREGNLQVALAGQAYRARVTALAPQVVAALDAAFDANHPLGREPLILEDAAFTVNQLETNWRSLTTYASLLTNAHPRPRLALRFLSPTAFRTKQDYSPVPPPRLCLEGYLRKWNAFADVELPAAALLEYAATHLEVAEADLRPARVWLGKYFRQGVMGRVVWQSTGGAPALLRLVNALADYAVYCGTGVSVAQGLGQTARG